MHHPSIGGEPDGAANWVGEDDTKLREARRRGFEATQRVRVVYDRHSAEEGDKGIPAGSHLEPHRGYAAVTTDFLFPAVSQSSPAATVLSEKHLDTHKSFMYD